MSPILNGQFGVSPDERASRKLSNFDESRFLLMLKNSFSGNFNKKVVRKLLNARWPQTLKFTEITALVPFSTPTGVYTPSKILS